MYIVCLFIFSLTHIVFASDNSSVNQKAPHETAAPESFSSIEQRIVVAQGAAVATDLSRSTCIERVLDGVTRDCSGLLERFSLSSLGLLSTPSVDMDKSLLRLIDAAPDESRLDCMTAINKQLCDSEYLPFFSACLDSQMFFCPQEQPKRTPLGHAYETFMAEQRRRLFSMDQELVRSYIAQTESKRLWSLATSCRSPIELFEVIKKIEHTSTYKKNKQFIVALTQYISDLVDNIDDTTFDGLRLLHAERSVEDELFDMLDRCKYSGLLLAEKQMFESFIVLFDRTIALSCDALKGINTLSAEQKSDAFSCLLPYVNRCLDAYHGCYCNKCSATQQFFINNYEKILNELAAFSVEDVQLIGKENIRGLVERILICTFKSFQQGFTSNQKDSIVRCIRTSLTFLSSHGIFEHEHQIHTFFWTVINDINFSLTGHAAFLNAFDVAINSLDDAYTRQVPTVTWLLNPGFKKSIQDPFLTPEMRQKRLAVLEFCKRQDKGKWEDVMVRHFDLMLNMTPVDSFHYFLSGLDPAQAPVILNYPLLGNLLISKLKPEHYHLLDLLKQLGLDINTRGIGDKTALMIAAQEGNLGLIDALLAHDADPVLVDTADCSVFTHAFNAHTADMITKVVACFANRVPALMNVAYGKQQLSVLSQFVLSPRVVPGVPLDDEVKKVIDCLVQRGASILQEDILGLSAIDHAARKGANELVDYLSQLAYASCAEGNPYVDRVQAGVCMQDLCVKDCSAGLSQKAEDLLDVLYPFAHTRRHKINILHEFLCLKKPEYGIGALDLFTSTKVAVCFERAAHSIDDLIKTFRVFMRSRSFKDSLVYKDAVVGSFYKHFAYLVNQNGREFDRIFSSQSHACELLIPLIHQTRDALVGAPHRRLHQLLVNFHRFVLMGVEKSFGLYARSGDPAEIAPVIDYLKNFVQCSYLFEQTSAEDQIVLSNSLIRVYEAARTCSPPSLLAVDLNTEHFLDLFDFIGFTYAVNDQAIAGDAVFGKLYQRIELSIKNVIGMLAAEHQSIESYRRYLYTLIRHVPHQYEPISRILNLYDVVSRQVLDAHGHPLLPLEVILNPGFKETFEANGLTQELLSHRSAILKIMAQERPQQFLSLAASRAIGLIHRATSVMELIPILDALEPLHAADILNFPVGGRLLIGTLSTQTQLSFLPLLISAGADINARGSHQQTPLMYAILQVNGALVERLMNAGADLSLVDDADRSILEYLLLSRFSDYNKTVLIHNLQMLEPSLYSRTIGQERLTPLAYYIKLQNEGLIGDSESLMCNISKALIGAGVKAAAYNCYEISAADMAYQAGLQELGNLCCSAAYDHADGVLEDPYIDRAAALELVDAHCRVVDLPHEAIEAMRATLKLLYKFDHTRVRKSRIQNELAQLSSANAAALASCSSASASSPHLALDRIIDADGNGLFTTYGSYRNMLLTGTLHAVFKRDIKPEAMREIGSLASHLCELVARRQGLATVEHISFDDYPHRDQVTLDGFKISRSAFDELLAITAPSSTRDIVSAAYESSAALRAVLADDIGMDGDDIQASLDLYDQHIIDLATVRMIVELMIQSPQRRAQSVK